MSEQQESNFTKILAEEKKTFYQFTNELVNSSFNVRIYYVLVAIEHLQIIAYQCHQVFQYDNIAVQWFRSFTRLINPQHYLKHSNLMDYFIPISFFMSLIHIALLVYGYYRHKHKTVFKETIENRKEMVTLVAHYFTVVMVTVMTTPIFLTSLLVFYCHSQSPYHPNRDCYNTYHLFLILMALVNIVWILVINVYFFLFYYTRNPFAYKNFLAVSSSLWNMLKFTVKVVPPGYLIFDQILEFNILFVFGLASGLLGYTAISRVLYPYTRYNKNIEKMMIFIEIISITVSMLFIMQAFFTEEQGNNISFIVSFIISIPLAKLAFEFTMYRKQQTIRAINDYKKDNTQKIEDLLTYLIVELENDSVQKSSKRFFKTVKFHNDKCDNVLCACHSYLEKYFSEQHYYEENQLIYKIFLEIIDRCVANNKKAYSLLLLKSHIEFYRLNNGIKGAFIISKIMREKISFFQDYLINGFLYEVSKSFEDTTGMETYRQFSEHLIRFEREAMNLAEFYAEFWQEVTQQNSSLKKVINLLKKARNSKLIVDTEFQTLYSIYPQNIRILDIYKQLYKEVLINYGQFMKYKSLHQDNLEEKEETKLMIRPGCQMKFTANQDLIVINTSVNVINDIFHGGCEIVSVTNNVYKVLGYSSQDLIGKNINRFLPKIYTDFHDDIIDNYLSRNSSTNIKPRELIIFPIDSSGHLVQCAMVNKIMPSLDYGVNIVSFLLNSKLSKENLIIYDQKTGLVDSMSQKAETLLLGKRVKKTSISIPDHISDILPVWDYLKEETNQHKKKSSQQLHLAFSNVFLYRSDGPPDNKYVKIITFELTFQSKIFTMQECLSENENFWLGFQTLMENTPNEFKIVQRKQKPQKSHLAASRFEENKSGMGQSPNMILPKSPTNKQSTIIEDAKLYSPLPKCYPKVYLALQVSVLLALMGMVVYNYARSLGYYNVLQSDIEVKEGIADEFALLLEGSHMASQYVFSGGDKVIYEQVQVEDAITELKEMITIGQYIYQQMVKKEKTGEIMISDMMVDVQYYASPTATVIKSQTVTDATYQLILYLLEIYDNSDPLVNLPNNVLFVFNNCLGISNQLMSLNQIFTNNLLKNSQIRKSDILLVIVGILLLFLGSLLWELIYKLIIDLKLSNVIEIYQSIPIEGLEKYPIKCQNFIKYVCPVETSANHMQATIKSIRNLGTALNHEHIKKEFQQNDSHSLLEEQQEDPEYISFSNSLSLRNIILQSIAFLLVFSVLFVVELNSQSQLLDKNLFEVSEWNKITRFRSELIKTVYLINEHKNRGGQWNDTQVLNFEILFQDSIESIEFLLKSTTALDTYLSISYELIQESVFIVSNSNVSSQQFVTNEEKISNLFERIEAQQIDGLFQTSINQTISSFLSMLQLIFIGQIILFLLYAVIYIPKSYKSYRQKNDITQMMFETLGYKLQNIAKTNIKNK